MSGVRDHVVLCWIAMAIGTVGLVVAGFWTWNGWLQLAAPLILAVIVTRLLAPVYYGWREPGEAQRRRARQR
jgi:membrane protein implicated in regulation of membrane protease activity